LSNRAGGERSLAFNAGEGDATRLYHCDHVSRHHDGARGSRPDRGANERPEQQRRADKQQRSDQQQRKRRRVGSSVSLAICVIAVVNIAIQCIVGIVAGDRIGERFHGGNRLRGRLGLGLRNGLSSPFAVAGGNTGDIDTGREHDGDGSGLFLADVLASGSLNGRRLGQPQRNRRYVARWMLTGAPLRLRLN
jgi:hypothetical protein